MDDEPEIKRFDGGGFSITSLYSKVHFLLESSAHVSADFFVDGILVGPGGADAEVTAVRNTTWGRIKASFRNR